MVDVSTRGRSSENLGENPTDQLLPCPTSQLLTSSLTLYLATTSGSTIVHVAVGQTTTSDLLADLGTPGKVFEKTDDRLGIHRAALSADEQTDAEGACAFCLVRASVRLVSKI